VGYSTAFSFGFKNQVGNYIAYENSFLHFPGDTKIGDVPFQAVLACYK
jgi:hypothetical protein